MTFIVTSIEKHWDNIVGLIDSYTKMKEYEETELILIYKELSQKRQNDLNEVISKNTNIRYYVKHGLSRCERKDYGAKIANATMVDFVDSDCIFKEDYYLKLKEHLNIPIIRGRNIFLEGDTWFSKMTSIYRTICDEYVFNNETFSPNLIIDKALLFKAGGWSLDNIDYSDDYNMSQRIHRIYHDKILFIPEAILYNRPDSNAKKTIKTWKEYGLGYAFRYSKCIEKEKKSFFKFVPPFVYMRNYGLDYFFFAIFQWIITTVSYVKEFIKMK